MSSEGVERVKNLTQMPPLSTQNTEKCHLGWNSFPPQIHKKANWGGVGESLCWANH